MCMCVSLCVRLIWREDVDIVCLPWVLCTLSFEKGPFIKPGAHIRLGWLANELQVSSCLHLPGTEVTDMCHQTQHLYRCWDLNSGNHACKASSLPTESSLQPLNSILNTFIPLKYMRCLLAFYPVFLWFSIFPNSREISHTTYLIFFIFSKRGRKRKERRRKF